jgi:hypothetical protein
MSSQCEHSFSGNPRNEGTCVKCGKIVSGRWLRDEERERLLALRASKRPEFTENLVAFAQQRAGDSPVRNLRSRNFHKECREEIADALNYLCWLDDQKAVIEGSGLNAGELACLFHITEAWRWLHTGSDE